MTLVEKQQAFGVCVARLLAFAMQQHLPYVIGEVERGAAQALWNAAKGRGIVKSLHRQRLAIDLLLYEGERYRDGSRAADLVAYRTLGDFWKSLSAPDLTCCWGGDFATADLGHFSILHQGVR